MLVDTRSLPVATESTARVASRIRHQRNPKTLPTQPAFSKATPALAMRSSYQHGAGDEKRRTERERNRFGVPHSPLRKSAGGDSGSLGSAAAGDEDEEDLQDQLEAVNLRMKLRTLKKQNAGRQ
ncbi:hypothetical protein LTR85_002988 [Meristemomyces frigidus]|nr:hypothetical protein LTR85_002988 [Meristemomyces frigidus]